NDRGMSAADATGCPAGRLDPIRPNRETPRMIGTEFSAPPATGPNALTGAALPSISSRELASDRYWSGIDTINLIRLWWRAHTVRHMFHVLPGETILELACGSGTLTPALAGVTRGECPITAATFIPGNDLAALRARLPDVEAVALSGFPGELHGRQFDYIV